jgi:DNA-binding FadR family transcriptional regulator
MKTKTPPVIPQISLVRASSTLADRLRELILNGTFQAGSMLPAERDMVIDSGLSRGSIREALKILETEGLVEIKTGRSGGALVTAPTRTSLARSVQVFVRANTVDLKTLLDCRVAVEPAMARLAAENGTLEQFAEIRAAHHLAERTINNVTKYRPANFAFHMAIAKAACNEPLSALMEAISGPVLEERGFARMTNPETRAVAVQEHELICRAIEARNGEEAARLMLAHLDFYSRRLRAEAPRSAQSSR